MGFGIVRSERLIVHPNEELDLPPLRLVKDERAVIHGTIILPNGKPAKGAIVKLLKVCRVTDHDDHTCDWEARPCDLEPVGHQFTDDCGQFLFPITDTTCAYVIKATLFRPKRAEPCEADC